MPKGPTNVVTSSSSSSNKFQKTKVASAATAASPSYIMGSGQGTFNNNIKPTTTRCCNHLTKSTSSDPSSGLVDLGHQGGGDGPPHSSRSSSSSSSAESILDVSYSSMESDNGRSVSYSSDKFPPHALVNARLHHADKIPFSPLALSHYDSSIPPPPPSPAGHLPKTLPSMSSLSGSRMNGQRNTVSSQYQRYCSFFLYPILMNSFLQIMAFVLTRNSQPEHLAVCS